MRALPLNVTYSANSLFYLSHPPQPVQLISINVCMSPPSLTPPYTLAILSHSLSDAPDVNSKLRDIIRRANCLTASFPSVGAVVLLPFVVWFVFILIFCYMQYWDSI